MGRGVVSVVVAVLACLGGAAAIEYVVGDDRGWTAPPNVTVGYYNNWAASKNFTDRDSLGFVSNGTHDVAMATKEEYDNCTKIGLTFVPPFVYHLFAAKNGTNYFISTVGSDCENGLKMAINVLNRTSAKLPDSLASSITTNTLFVLVLISSSIIPMFIM